MTMSDKKTRTIIALSAFAGLTAHILSAQAEDARWTGEGAFSAGTSSGNTQTSDLGLGLKLERNTGPWTFGVQARADYGETDATETRNRIFLSGNFDHQLRDTVFGFGQLTYEKDAFSGFASRIFIGAGLGLDAVKTDTMVWNLRGGPGLKIDEIDATITSPAKTENSFGATAQSHWSYQVNEHVKVNNDTGMTYAQTSTQWVNMTGLTASLSDALSARLSFEVRHETHPPIGREQTDTISRISLVYAIGK